MILKIKKKRLKKLNHQFIFYDLLRFAQFCKTKITFSVKYNTLYMLIFFLTESFENNNSWLNSKSYKNKQTNGIRLLC